MHEAVMFFKNFNNAFNKTGNIIWTTLLVAGVGGLIGLLVIGFTTKFKAGGGP
jgi:2,3-bisphosphoglycerate-independent phosphoglycerate mutase